MKKTGALLLAAGLMLSLTACQEQSTAEENMPAAEEQQANDAAQQSEETEEKENTMTNSTTEPSSSDEKGDSAVTETTDSGMRPEFKETMDSYEAFYDEYCDFIKKYNENPDDLSMLTEYADMMTQLTDMNEKFAAWEDEDLNTEELNYYIEVNSRITQKLLEAGE